MTLDIVQAPCENWAGNYLDGQCLDVALQDSKYC